MVWRGGGVGIVPTAHALALAQLHVPGHHVEALGLGVAAPALGVGLAGLGAGPDQVEVAGLANGLVAVLVEVLIPKRVLDDDLALGVDLMGGPQDAAHAHLVHEIGVEVGKAALAAGLVALLAGAIGEEEVVDHHRVEHGRRAAEDGLHQLLGGRVGIAAAVLPVVGHLGQARGRHAAMDQEAFGLEAVAGLFQQLLLDEQAVAEGFDIDLLQLGFLAPGDAALQALLGAQVAVHGLGREQG